MKEIQSSEVDNFLKVINEIVSIKRKKASDYGNSWRLFGLEGLYYPIGTKFMRLWNLRSKEPENESVRDTLRDLAVYCIMAIQMIDSGETSPEIDKWLGKEFKEKK